VLRDAGLPPRQTESGMFVAPAVERSTNFARMDNGSVRRADWAYCELQGDMHETFSSSRILGAAANI